MVKKNNLQVRRNKTAGKLAEQFNDNPYLAALIDPEHSDPIGVPDAYSGLVHKSRILTQRSGYFLGGKCSGMVFPTPKGHLATTSAGTTGATLYVPQWEAPGTMAAASNEFLVMSSEEHVNYDAFDTDTEYPERTANLVKGSGCSFVFYTAPLINTADSSGDPYPCEPRYISSVAQAMPAVGYAATTIHFRLTADGVYGAINEVRAYIRTVDAGGNVTRTNSAYNTTTNATQEFSISAPANEYLFEYGFELAAAAVGNQRILNARFSMDGYGQLDEGSMVYFNIGDNDEYELLKDVSDSFRVAAMSVWIIYNGSMTSNGKIAVGMVQEQGDGSLDGEWDYGRLSTTPGCYSGPLTKGGYAFWRPTTPQDTWFKSLVNERDSKSYLAFAVEANDVNAQNITIRVCAHLEVQTTNQVLGPRPSLVYPNWISDAQTRLALLPTGMENDSHLRRIAEFLRNATNRVGKFSNAVAGIPYGQALLGPILNVLRAVQTGGLILSEGFSGAATALRNN